MLEPASVFSSHSCSELLLKSAAPRGRRRVTRSASMVDATTTAATNAPIRTGRRRRLRNHFNAHLLAAKVVRDVLGGDGEGVGAGWQILRNGELAGAGGRGWIPAKTDGSEAFETGAERSRGLRGGDAKLHGVSGTEALVIQMHMHGGRRARDYEGLCFAPGMACRVAQNEAHAIDAILHIGRGKEARLPNVF